MGASVVPALFSRSDGTPGGVDILGTQRIRDGFLESRAHQEHATYAGLGALSGTYADIEATFGEPSTTGLQSQLSSFWSSWSTVANDPGSSGPRSLLLEQAGTLATTFNDASRQLTQQWDATRDQVATTVADVNSMAGEVARLNGAIRSASLTGNPANDLSDQRDLLVTRIAEASGAVATPADGGMVNLTLAGRSLVTGIRAAQLQATGPTSYPGATGPPAPSASAGRAPTRPPPSTAAPCPACSPPSTPRSPGRSPTWTPSPSPSPPRSTPSRGRGTTGPARPAVPSSAAPRPRRCAWS